MLNSTTKQKINNLRDLLVGKIPNPQGQVQQITLALIYKFMSDIDDETSGIFANGSFFPGEFAQYKWTHLMDSKLSAQERLNLYAEGISKIKNNHAIPSLFHKIFKPEVAFLPYRDPQTLDRFLKQINEFNYEHSEDLGDAFEYLLSCLSAAGDAGMFRTPRHIIDFIVDIVQPKITDKILDPACGTAGFLISAYKYLTKHNKDIDMTRLSDQIIGYDISPEMEQLALVNLYLHQFPDPRIEEYDTLSDESKWSDKFDCILANPPFMTPKGGIQPHNKFSITSNRSEVLFVDYIMEHLRSTGKAGIIVPEGVIFQSANAYKALRKMLIEDGGLWAVVSLPAGVFQPYSGVKTSILLLDKTIKTDSITFAKITADGHDLGAQRREISKNDIPTVLEGLLQIKQGLMSERTQFLASDGGSDLIRSVPKTDLADDYNLSAERYKTGPVAHTGSYEMVELGELVEIYDSKRKPLNKSERKEGIYPYYGATGIVDYIDDFLFDERLLLLGEDGAKRGSGDKTAFIVEGKYRVNNHAHVLKCKDGIIIDTYLLNILNNMDLNEYITGVTVPKLNQEKMRSIKIPLPPLEIQEQIVKELDGYQAIIDGAKQIISHWKPTIEVDSEWEMVKLGEYALKVEYGIGESAQDEGELRYVRITDIDDFYQLSNEGKKYLKLTDESKNYILEKGDILIARTGATYGKTLYFESDEKSAFAGYLIRVKFDSKIDHKFFAYFAQSDNYREQAKLLVSGGGQPQFNANAIKQIEIPLPPLEIQQSIVARIQHEQSLVDSAKELVKIYEEKVKERVERVWVG